jgi:transcriptional regulator with XRE-family HTH domain
MEVLMGKKRRQHKCGVHPIVAELKRIRKLKGLSQQKVADRAGVSRDWLGFAESGRVSPSAYMLGYLAGAFGLRVALVPIDANPSDNRENETK